MMKRVGRMGGKGMPGLGDMGGGMPPGFENFMPRR